MAAEQCPVSTLKGLLYQDRNADRSGCEEGQQKNYSSRSRFKGMVERTYGRAVNQSVGRNKVGRNPVQPHSDAASYPCSKHDSEHLEKFQSIAMAMIKGLGEGPMERS